MLWDVAGKSKHFQIVTEDEIIDANTNRFTPGDGYLEALCEDNVTVRRQEIAQVVPDGLILDDGTKVELEVLICATGFNTSFRPPFKLIGENGAVLNEKWETEPRAYLGIAAAQFPNYFSA